MSLLAALAARGRWLLIAGLAVGILFPGLSTGFTPVVVPLLAVMLCIAALREGPVAALPRAGEAPRALVVTIVLQSLLPLAASAALWAAGLLSAPLAIGAVLALAAAPITGTPGMAVMTGADARISLRQLTIGVALLPLTAAPVFAILPIFPDPWAVAAGALRLLAVVVLAGGIAHVLRARLPALARPEAQPALDGIMALAMAVVVIGLMSAVGPAIRTTPLHLLLVLGFAMGLYLVQTLSAWHIARAAVPRQEALAFAIAAGNRNLALFLAAMPAETAAPLLLFVGCYQVPMYLTPLMLPRLTGTRWSLRGL
ncbi:MAG: hypothetical protein QNK42_11250 [Pseudodonghicola sp.]|nr:hypothetical protein [Pseudodonghicola sp.]